MESRPGRPGRQAQSAAPQVDTKQDQAQQPVLESNRYGHFLPLSQSHPPRINSHNNSIAFPSGPA